MPPNLLISCAVCSIMVYAPFLAIIQKHRYRALKSVNCSSFCAKLPKLSVRVDARHWPVDAPCRKFHSIFRPIQTTCRFPVGGAHCVKPPRPIITYHLKAIPHNSKCRYGERGAADAKPKAGCFIEHFGNADAVPQPPERCLSRKAGIMRCCLNITTFLPPPKIPRHLFPAARIPMVQG